MLIGHGLTMTTYHAQDIKISLISYKGSSAPITPSKPPINPSHNQDESNNNRLKPNKNAVGDHTSFKRNSVDQKIYKYETYRSQTNPYDPKPWESVKRFDGANPAGAHFNKHLGQHVYEPHVHEPTFPGGVRPAQSWEIPN